ncbi:MAG TPA: D-alanine--D-alanine ligase [Candidatus Kapabacteria bacterium]|nr:D-alanine--D-alanine ligase [Candidatus Kapabacteria bacterium]
MANKKLRVGVIFGGRTGEHEVSLVSAASVMNALDKEKYEVVPIGITKEGKWLSSSRTMALLKSGKNSDHEEEKILLPDPTKQQLTNVEESRDNEPLDVVFPVLHGRYGEDGTMQGLLELANIPYVGAGVLGSALGLDKVVQKQLFAEAGLPIVKYGWFTMRNYSANPEGMLSNLETHGTYPMFVKPANTGSSVGITKAHNREELRAGIELAAKYDRKIVIENGLSDVREIECAVLGNDNPKASVLGEVTPSNEFYDYNAKYVDGESQITIPAQLPADVAEKVREYAIRAFQAIDCSGMARVDFFVVKGTNEIFLNEVNTIPGFTAISMYPKLWEATGLPYAQLLDKLIELAIERHNEMNKLQTEYKPNKKWYE